MLCNYHTHTFRNRHSSGTEREYIEAAIGCGIRALGFSEHAPYRYPDGYSSWWRVGDTEVSERKENLAAYADLQAHLKEVRKY